MGCQNERNRHDMLEKKLTEYKSMPVYHTVHTAANSALNNWLNDSLTDIEVLKECIWKVDDALLFNTEKNRAYLLLLIQDQLPQAEMDYVYVMYAALEDEKWNIYFAGLPNLVFPRDRFKHQPLSFAQLSKLSRQQLLPSYLNRNGEVNDDFVNDAYTQDLKAKQLKFLQNK